MKKHHQNNFCGQIFSKENNYILCDKNSTMITYLVEVVITEFSLKIFLLMLHFIIFSWLKKKYIYQYFLFYLVNNYLFFLHFRVFKKGSPNGKITVYLGRRDFVDHVSHVDPIDGVVLVDPEYLNGRKVFGHVLAAFRYGREDLDVLGKNKKKKW